MKNETYTVSANDIEIWARIGVHPEEALVENCFRVSVEVEAAAAYAEGKYLDYEIIVDKVQMVFNRPNKVLEDICGAIIDEVKAASPLQVRRIRCMIRKMNPSFQGIKISFLSADITRSFE